MDISFVRLMPHRRRDRVGRLGGGVDAVGGTDVADGGHHRCAWITKSGELLGIPQHDEVEK